MSLAEAPRLRPVLELPRLRAPDASAIADALDHAGCAIVEDAIDKQAFARVADALQPWFDAARCGEGHFFGRKTKRFSAIFAKAPETSALALAPNILSAVEQALLGPAQAARGDCIQLNLTQAIEIAPGEHAQLLHRDDNLFPFEKRFELMVNVMWAIDPFTAENGATRMAPGSHLWRREDDDLSEYGVQSAEAGAGSAIMWVGSLLHGGGANLSQLPRRGLVISYSLAWLAPAEKLLLSIPRATAEKLPERLQRLIGYQVHRPNLGWVEGRDPIEWLHGETRALASARDNLTPIQEQMLAEHFSRALP